MKVEKIINNDDIEVTEITADEGKVLVRLSNPLGKTLRLGKFDSPKNYIEIKNPEEIEE